MGNSYPFVARPETLHFNIGTLGAPTLAAPGVATPAAFAFFGRLNVAQDKELEVAHLHLEVGGAAGQQLHLEIWRRRDGVMTLLCPLDYVSVGGETYITRAGIPVGELAMVRAGDYIFCQAVTGSTGAPGDGLTVDLHYLFADGVVG